MKHEESRLQQQCVAWFRAQYPQYAMLLTHPANEGNGNRISGAIHKAEGTVKGVPDLIFFVMSSRLVESIPATANECKAEHRTWVNGLGVELKTPKGSQSQEQKDFQKMFEAAGYMYVVVRRFEEFQEVMKDYVSYIPSFIGEKVLAVNAEIVKAAEEREREKFRKVVGRK